MLNEILVRLFDRDIARLRVEIEQYGNEADLWKKTGEIPNAAGNLAMHLTGNLRHYIGAVLGGSGYVRQRPLEFSESDISREKLLADIDEASAVVKSTLQKLTDNDLAKPYPLDESDPEQTTAENLIKVATHLNYHLGQINYHRRLLSGSKK